MNTIVLYIRMIVLLLISLYTSRIVLSALGVTDYGLYNVIGGVVALFSFISAAMSNASQRFIVFALGKGDEVHLKAVFSSVLMIHILLALLIFVLCETIGVWYLETKMVIPDDRMYASHWVFQMSIITCILSITNVPYNALIIAHERMSAFAYITILDSILKFAIAFFIQIVTFDRLVLYSILILLVQLIDIIIYQVYCRCKFIESRFSFIFDKAVFREVFKFASWSLIGNLAWICYTQGLNLLLNAFFGPVVNAARGIAVQVQSSVTNFIKGFQTAINPQITKSYAIEDFERVKTLVYVSSRYSFYLLLCVALPIFIESPSILSIWLKEVPDHTINFVRILMLIMLIGPFENPIDQAVRASGQIKYYQIFEGGFLLLILPVSYICLRMGLVVESVYFVQLIIFIIVQGIRVLILKRKMKFSLLEYMSQVMLRPIITFLLSAFVCFVLHFYLKSKMQYTIILCIPYIISILLIIWIVGLSNNERRLVFSKIKMLLISKINK